MADRQAFHANITDHAATGLRTFCESAGISKGSFLEVVGGKLADVDTETLAEDPPIQVAGMSGRDIVREARKFDALSRRRGR